VRKDELQAALATMQLDEEGEKRIAEDVTAGRLKLLWLTLWDWDGDEVTDRVTIASGSYRLNMPLPRSRKTIAIPDPPSSYIEVTGEQQNVGYEGWTTLAVLSGARPIAFSRILPGKSIRIEVE
jgi:hypothetical protein